jgi:hypothetical protein
MPAPRFAVDGGPKRVWTSDFAASALDFMMEVVT